MLVTDPGLGHTPPTLTALELLRTAPVGRQSLCQRRVGDPDPTGAGLTDAESEIFFTDMDQSSK